MIVFFKKMGNSVYDSASAHEITDNLTGHDIENIQVTFNKQNLHSLHITHTNKQQRQLCAT